MESYHILIVEDDKEIREGIEIYLKNQGYSVTQAADGFEGLQKIESEEFHLAIVDIMMPRMDGITMMMKVREKGYEFPVIMLSAKSEEVDKIMGLNMGADELCDEAVYNNGITCACQFSFAALQTISRCGDGTGKSG